MTTFNLISSVRIRGKNSRIFKTKDELCRGDELACLRFIIALKKAVRDTRIRDSGTIISLAVLINKTFKYWSKNNESFTKSFFSVNVLLYGDRYANMI